LRLDLANRWKNRRFRLAFAWTRSLAAVRGLGVLVYTKLVEGAWIRYNKWDRRERGTLRVGQQAPDLELLRVDEGSVRLSELWRERPVFLVFGSCT
jgi:hypothetical protein